MSKANITEPAIHKETRAVPSGVTTIYKRCEDCGDCWTYRQRETRCVICGGKLIVAVGGRPV